MASSISPAVAVVKAVDAAGDVRARTLADAAEIVHGVVIDLGIGSGLAVHLSEIFAIYHRGVDTGGHGFGDADGLRREIDNENGTVFSPPSRTRR